MLELFVIGPCHAAGVVVSMEGISSSKPVLDCIDLEVARQPDGRTPRPDTIIDRCKATWENFKSFNRDATVTAITHTLAVVRSHYLAIDLQAIGAGFARGTKATEHQQLEDEVEDVVKKLASNVNLFGKMDGDGQA